MKKSLNFITMTSLLTLFVSCKEIKLNSCDIDVYHDDLGQEQLVEIKDNAYYEKNWNITFINKSNSPSVDRRKQHADISHKMNTKLIDSRLVKSGHVMVPSAIFGHRRYVKKTAYKEQRKAETSCDTLLRFYSPDIGKSKIFKVDDSLKSEFSYRPFRELEYKKDEFCKQSLVSIVEKLPTCTLK